MKSTSLTSCALFLIIQISLGQSQSFELSFTGIDNADYRQLDSIRVINRTHGGDTLLSWPDTVLVLDYFVGIQNNTLDNSNFRVLQNFPNPVSDQTAILLDVPEEGPVRLMLSDLAGRTIIEDEMVLDKGRHHFDLVPGLANIYFFSAMWKGKTSSIKITVDPLHSTAPAALHYVEMLPLPEGAQKRIAGNFYYIWGDQLLFVGYFDDLQSGIIDKPEESKTYIFQFATNIPCPGMPSITYEGQVYNTIQIFSQCWLKENLNVGERINGEKNQSDNGIIEKYCYGDNETSCDNYGGLYQWSEMMQYTESQGSQGICPSGWHIPTDEEWKVLEGSVDSQFKYGDPEWDQSQIYRGYNADTNLSAYYGWSGGYTGKDLFGFTALPGGLRAVIEPYFINGAVVACWWSSNGWGAIQKWDRGIRAYWGGGVGRYHDDHNLGESVRCIKDL